jgi:hypothetical protein
LCTLLSLQLESSLRSLLNLEHWLIVDVL